MRKFIISICLILTVTLFFSGCTSNRVDYRGIWYDSKTPYPKLIKHAYPEEQIDALQQQIHAIRTYPYLFTISTVEEAQTYVTFEELSEQFEIECIRKGNDGEFYVLLLQEDGMRVVIPLALMEDEMEELDKKKPEAAAAFREAGLDQSIVCVWFNRFSPFLSVEDFYEARDKGYTRKQVQEMDPNSSKLMVSLDSTSHVVKEGVVMVLYKPDSTISQIVFTRDDDPNFAGTILTIDKKDY